MIFEARREGFEVSTDPTRMALDRVEALVRTSYWAPERSREAIEVSLRNSRNFGLYEVSSDLLIGLARVVTDYSTFAWVCDVIVDEAYRRRGLGVWLMESVFSDPQLGAVRRWTLATRTAHGLYARFGFKALAKPGNWMERRSAF